MSDDLLETHGCQGGAHAGYVRAGWNVTGVDIDERHAKYYPGELIVGDAATYIRIRKGGYVPKDMNVVKDLLGIEHRMTWNGLFECLPPAYTEYLGRRMLEALGEAAA